METGNHQAPHQPERPESLDEINATARIKFDMLAAIGVFTQGQAHSILQLLDCGETKLSSHDRVFRDNILRYLKKEADFVTVFSEMLQIDKHPAALGTESQRDATLKAHPGKSVRVPPKPSKRGPSVAPTPPKRRWAQTSIMTLAALKTYVMPVIVASGVVILAVHVVLTPGNTRVSPEPEAKSVTLKGDAGSIALAPVAAIFPSTLSPAHAGEESEEAYLNTCYDQFKANREINANGGLSWNQNGGGYYAECLKRLQP